MELLNRDIKYGFPQLGAKDRLSGWFENSETVPDIQIYNTPDDIAAGRDPQLDAAIDDLLKKLPSPSNKNSDRR
jgi:tricorn protease